MSYYSDFQFSATGQKWVSFAAFMETAHGGQGPGRGQELVMGIAPGPGSRVGG